MQGKIEKTADAQSAGVRLDLYLKNAFPKFSRAQWQQALRSGRVRVNGQPARPAYGVKPGDRISGEMPVPNPAGLPMPEALPVEVVYEDRYLAAVHKTAGLVVHPGAGRGSGTLVNALLARFPRLSSAGGPGRPGIVHRLDKETSGLMLVAKSDFSHRALAEAFKKREVRKTYRALVWGQPAPSGVIDRPLARSRADRKRWRVDSKGRNALTEYRLRRTLGFMSELLVIPKTGRTHQIRVHLASIGHPVVADRTYGGGVARALRFPARERERALSAARAARRHLLHAEVLEFDHPKTGRRLRLSAPPPPDMARILRMLWP